MEALGVVAFVVVLAVVAGIVVLQRMIYICQPNEVLLFSGKRGVGPDGRVLGYRIVQGGRGVRIPVLERVDRMDLTNMIIDVRVSNAYSRGGIPLTVHAVANTKIASHQPRLDNAIERILTKDRDTIMTIARETLEGNLRGVLSKLTPEEVNEDRMSFERALLDEAEHDLSKLGLSLDTLTIQSVSDDVGYLSSIGRSRAAELMKNARIAEAQAASQAAVRDASNTQSSSIAQIQANIAVINAESERRIIDAQTRGVAMVAEAQSDVIARKAKAEAELMVQEQRLEQVRRQLRADVTEPARATMLSLKAQAEGKASTIAEEGKANAEALRALFQVWHAAGDNARDLFIGHKLDVLLRTMLGTLKDLNIDKMTIIDSRVAAIDRNGSAPMRAASAVEQLKQTLGVDLAELAKGIAATRPPNPQG